MSFVIIIKRRISDLKISQRQLAQKLGTSQPRISRMLKKRNAHLWAAIELMTALAWLDIDIKVATSYERSQVQPHYKTLKTKTRQKQFDFDG